MIVGIDFQIMMRLLAVSATARMVPSVATAVGKRNPVWLIVKVLLTKSGWPRTTLAVPRHTAQRAINGRIVSSGPGKLWVGNSRTRLLIGIMPVRLASAANRIPFA